MIIEERARKLFPECVVQYPEYDIPYNQAMSNRRIGYICGAKEQKQIDIKNAQDALYGLVNDLGCDLLGIDKAKDYIRKAMEE